MGIDQWFPNCAPWRPGAPQDFVRGAEKACKSCCTYCFSHNNCSVKVASSNVPSKTVVPKLCAARLCQGCHKSMQKLLYLLLFSQ